MKKNNKGKNGKEVVEIQVTEGECPSNAAAPLPHQGR